MHSAQAPASTVPARVDAIGWGWRHPGRRAWAVRGLDLRVEAGQRMLLLGASGAGKSTVLAGLAGVLGADDDGEREGSLLIDGREAAASRGRTGLVLQDPDSQVILARVGDDVAFGCENLGVPRDEIWRRVGEALELVGLRMPLHTPTSTLSGGQKQRLAIAGVLAMHPGLLLLDEPTANLDPDGVAEVRHAVGRTLDATGATCVIVEHRVEVWRDLVDRVVVIGPQGVIVDGAPNRVLEGHASELAALGIWVPGHRMPRPSRAHRVPERLLTTAELAVGYGTRTVAHAPELTVAEGELLAITGPNGSGKSTLGMALAGLSRPVAGRVVASDKLAAGRRVDPSAWKSRELLTRIGTVFQVPDHQFLGSTVMADLEIGPRALGLPTAEITARVEPMLERLRLSHLAAANPFTLSGGEKRRLSVAGVLAARPAALVLDEPTFGQDLLTWNELVLMLAELLDEGIGMVAMTHDLPFIEALADASLDLAEGDVVARVSA